MSCLSFYFPDVMLIPPGSGEHVQDPPVLVKVVSCHSAVPDCRAKYAAYIALPGLQAYLVAEEQECRVYPVRGRGRP